ncbi:MAG: DUF427 domain-containing protein [Nakamurella sp.]
MAVSMNEQMMSVLPELRVQPTMKRIRVRLGDELIADTQDAVLIWEPKRVVASYAVPVADVVAALRPAADAEVPGGQEIRFGSGPPVLDPSQPFAIHTAAGRPLTIRTESAEREAAAFRPADPDLAGYVVLDFDAFQWWEEDDPIVGHPRDPFHRIDIRRSSRPVRLSHGDVVLAESTNSRMLFEGTFPMARYYLPRADVQVELLPGTANSTCAYKGHATHYSVLTGGEELSNIAWSYEDPLDDATAVKGLICFYQERLDLVVDGEPVDRVRTPWS